MSEQPVVIGGRYRIERELGRGGMGKVFLATDTVLGRQVAVKVLAPQIADDESFVQRFRREAQTVARISDPNVVAVYDTGADQGIQYIVMEYVEGRTLADYLADGGRIMPERACEIAGSVCGALEAAHNQGVIHRDIKPGNIMLTPAGQVKVTDFGVARLTTTAETIAQTAAVLGTAAYFSPEQAQGQAVDGRSDIYSLGCVLYEMVTGRPPFLGDSPVTVASKHVLEQPTPPSTLNPDVTPDLDAVILRALSKNPANRYGSASEFRADLDRLRRGAPVEATPVLPAAAPTQVVPPTPPPAAPPERRSRWWIPVVVIGVILAGIAVLLWLFARSGNEAPKQVTIPSVVDMKQKDAETALTDAGLVPADKTIKVEDATKTPGTVVAQDPRAGTVVEEGTSVTLTVVKTPGPVTIPPVENLTLAQAQTLLEQAGFVVTSSEETSPTVPQGQVIRTEPPSGQQADYGSTVNVVVSSGTGTVAVPDVVCLNLGQAKGRLQDAGLVPIVASETQPPNPLCPNGNKVVSTDPTAGTQVPSGSQVTIVMPGAPPTTPPTPTPTPSPT